MATETRSRRLSTGHEVTLPLAGTCTLGGAIVPARRSGLAELLPSALSPLPLGPRLGGLVVAAFRYHRVGGPAPSGSRSESRDRRRSDAFDPYDEVAVIVPAIRRRSGRSALLDGATDPVRSLAAAFRGVGAYVHWQSVSTDAAVALGRELWGLPKERADVTVTDGPNGLRAAVDVDAVPIDSPAGGSTRRRRRVLSLEIPRRRGRRRSLAVRGYARPAEEPGPPSDELTTPDESLVRTRVEFAGEVGFGTGLGAAVEVGNGPVADGLRDWVVGRRPLATVYGGDLAVRLHPSERAPAGPKTDTRK